MQVIKKIMHIPDMIVEQFADECWRLTFKARPGWFKSYQDIKNKKKNTIDNVAINSAILAFKITELDCDIRWIEQLNLQLATFEPSLDYALNYQSGCWWLLQQFVLLSPEQQDQDALYYDGAQMQLTLASWMEQLAKAMFSHSESEKAQSGLMVNNIWSR